ncbi:hypothetical protein FHG87_015315 [Trinorchestia longiramus]|nr:hypothetical protein FHG87_015315 [Trinorchestia longiramus]
MSKALDYHKISTAIRNISRNSNNISSNSSRNSDISSNNSNSSSGVVARSKGKRELGTVMSVCHCLDLRALACSQICFSRQVPVQQLSVANLCAGLRCTKTIPYVPLKPEPSIYFPVSVIPS